MSLPLRPLPLPAPDVHALYVSGKTQAQIATILGTTRRQVHLCLVKHGTETRAGQFAEGHPGHSLRHGLSRASEYSIWRKMIDRCRNSDAKEYPNYGGRGIKVHPDWVRAFDPFIEHIGLRPSRKHTLDRINNDGNYEPGNVRWATRADQARNKRTNRWIEFAGRRMVLEDWAKQVGICPNSMAKRLRNYPLSIALSLKKLPTGHGSLRLKEAIAQSSRD